MTTDMSNTDLTPEEAIDRVWHLADKIGICMLTTWDGEEQRSRPMAARLRRDENAIYFLTDLEGHKLTEIDRYPHVSLAWADNSAHKYVVIAGDASVHNDRALIRELWNDFDKAWWDDASDPSIRLLKVTPDDAELWDSPGRVVAGAKMLMAAITGKKPDMGDNAKVEL